MYNDGLWIYMRCLKDTPHPPPRFQLGLPRLLILDRRMTVLAGVFYGASSKSVPSMAFAFKHTRVCLLALSMTEHAWRPLRSAQTLWWHACHNRHSEWASLSALVFSVITWTPGQMVHAQGSGFRREGPPCAFHLLTGSLSPLPALFSIAWTDIHTDNFTLKKWCGYLHAFVYAFFREKEVLVFYVIYLFIFISGCFNITIALYESIHGEALGSAFFYFNSY